MQQAKTGMAQAEGEKSKAKSQAKSQAKGAQPGSWLEIAHTVFWAVVFALIFRIVAYEPFNIPSKSMMPTLLVGDYLLVSKYSYGYSRHSFPFVSLPIFKGRLFESPVQPGDIAVFKWPRDNKTDYIKRIVGVPGDRIQVIGGVLQINGQAVKRERIKDFTLPDRYGNIQRYPQYRETLTNGVSYNTLDTGYTPADDTGVFIVPAGHYFAMGDNRDHSSDSRVPNSGVGFVPAENLVGRAEVLFFSTDGSARLWQVWRWISAARLERFFDRLH